MFAEPVLEFDALRTLVGRYVRSALGRSRLPAIAPSEDRVRIENDLADAAEGMAYWRAASSSSTSARGATVRISFGEIADPMEAVQRLRIEGATLEALEIFELTKLLDLGAEARLVLLAARENFPRLAAYGNAIADLRDLAHELSGKILPDGSLADHASVALGRLRRDAEKQRQSIQHSLDRFLRTHHGDGTLQEDFVTIRNDRFVVPVVTGRERGVNGVIHGASGSGHTLFVEPLETIQLNNELVRLREEELREIHRILREFTARLRAHSSEIIASTEALAKLELIFAKAEFATDFRCVVPRISGENAPRKLIVREARHPLLEDILRRQRKAVVPVTFDLDAQQRTLLISGPNTGGKTVTLKTAGLLALMAHAGLPVPAVEAEFPLFDQVLADIGDHQSIEESLSTFSGHIVSIRRMLEQATPFSLVVMDELGRATDPEEGGALGVSVLDRFLSRGVFTLASTHLVALKLFGASTAGVRNGSMGFNEETLEPTYLLRLGAPGKSAGLDIASRLGLDPELIQEARSRMTGAERDIAHFLNQMHVKLDALDAERKAFIEKEKALAEREQLLEQSWEKKYSAKLRELEQKTSELSADFEQKAQETISDLSQKARVRIAKTRREFHEAVDAAVEQIAPKPARNEPPKAKLEEGARVRLKGIRQPATVRRILGNGLIEVDAGFMKMQVAAADVVEVLGAAAVDTKRSPSVSFKQGPSFGGNYREINLIGQRAEEACAQVDKFLDSAALAQVERVRIVHGHGMGILKRSIAELLARNPHVETFHAGAPEEGGGGATIVILRD